MKYRIKVFPYKGRLRYMPQKKSFWFFWYDMIYANASDEYQDFHLDVMSSDRSCIEWIRRVEEENQKYDNRIAHEKKFVKDNPVRYIEVVL